jgi:hypothetical protein
MYQRMVLTAAAAVTLLSTARAADLPRKAPDLTIGMNSGRPIQISQYKGKVVALCFILTTCPHCQKTIGLLSKLQNEMGPRGLQGLGSAIQEGAALAVPGFIRTFNPPFPVGFNDPRVAIDFMQHPPMLIPHMPLLAFIDRQGMIRAQFEGDNHQFFSDQQEENLRKQIDMLLKEGSSSPKKGTAKKAAPAKKQG